MEQDPKPDDTGRLPQMVGYQEVQKHLGVSRRTIERMVRKGDFPQPLQLTPNRVAWKIETVLGWLDAKKIWTPNDIKIPDGDIVVDPEDPMIKRLRPYITAAGFATLLGRPVSTAELGPDFSLMISSQETETMLEQGTAGYRRGEQ